MTIGTILFNPFTGAPRHPSDIASDPKGLLIWDGEEPLRAAQAAQPERAPLSDAEIEDLRGEANRGYCIDKGAYFKAFRDAEQAHGIKQGGQQ